MKFNFKFQLTILGSCNFTALTKEKAQFYKCIHCGIAQLRSYGETLKIKTVTASDHCNSIERAAILTFIVALHILYAVNRYCQIRCRIRIVYW